MHHRREQGRRKAQKARPCRRRAQASQQPLQRPPRLSTVGCAGARLWARTRKRADEIIKTSIYDDFWYKTRTILYNGPAVRTPGKLSDGVDFSWCRAIHCFLSAELEKLRAELAKLPRFQKFGDDEVRNIQLMCHCRVPWFLLAVAVCSGSQRTTGAGAAA